MDKYSLMVPNFIPTQEYFDPKHSDTCIGCGVSLAARLVGKALEKALAGAVCTRRSGADFDRPHSGLLRRKRCTSAFDPRAPTTGVRP